MDAQAGLHLGCSQTPEDRFSRVEAHMGCDVRKSVLMRDSYHPVKLQMQFRL